MDIDEKLAAIAEKLALLRQRDASCKLFGADSHGYVLNPVLQEKQVAAFEKEHGIVLPAGYRHFLQVLGDGGAGPYYGLEPLERGLWAFLDADSADPLLDPALPFPFTTPWNMSFDGDEDDEVALARFEEEYFDTKWMTGALRICNFGCGVYLNLVLNGPEAGHIWVDDRCNSSGIYPDPYFGQQVDPVTGQGGRINFLDWYELWLDQSLAKAGAK